jgi:RNA polymerase sigma factor (sigma-70 family)
MPDMLVPSSSLKPLLARASAGDIAARNELFEAVYEPLVRRVRRQLACFPTVRRWDEADDVLHSALYRLLCALAQRKPDSVAAFFALASVEIRGELLDRARRYSRPAWRFTHGIPAPLDRRVPFEESVPDCKDNPKSLAEWTTLQEASERLPAAEREVISLALHHGWTQARMTELFHVTEQTIRHRWDSAVRKLRRRMDDGVHEGSTLHQVN